MTDIHLEQTPSLEGVTLDWLMRADGTLDDRQELASAVIMALGTDALAAVDDELPDPDDTNRRGWWGDFEAEQIWGGWPVGTRLWLLSRAKITGQNARGGGTLFQIESYLREGLQPLVTNKIASRFEIDVQRVGVSRVDANVTIYRGPSTMIQLRFQSLWDQIRS